MSVTAKEAIEKMGIKIRWLAGKLDMPVSSLHYHLDHNLSDEQAKMIIRVIEHAYTNYFLEFKSAYESQGSH